METKIRHVTQRELATRWNKSEATIERYRSEGLGPVYLKIGGQVMYRIEDILQFENDCLHMSTAEMAHQKATEFRISPLSTRLNT